MTFIVIREKGEGGPCSVCPGDVVVYDRLMAEARFLIIKLADRPSLGGGQCPRCRRLFCVSCATKTVYGNGMRRLHCPTCGSLLAGVHFKLDVGGSGAFLSDPPEFHGRPAPAPSGEPDDSRED